MIGSLVEDEVLESQYATTYMRWNMLVAVTTNMPRLDSLVHIWAR